MKRAQYTDFGPKPPPVTLLRNLLLEWNHEPRTRHRYCFILVYHLSQLNDCAMAMFYENPLTRTDASPGFVQFMLERLFKLGAAAHDLHAATIDFILESEWAEIHRQFPDAHPGMLAQIRQKPESARTAASMNKLGKRFGLDENEYLGHDLRTIADHARAAGLEHLYPQYAALTNHANPHTITHPPAFKPAYLHDFATGCVLTACAFLVEIFTPPPPPELIDRLNELQQELAAGLEALEENASAPLAPSTTPLPPHPYSIQQHNSIGPNRV